jgi:3-methyladenine DNA glycosylase AlkD
MTYREVIASLKSAGTAQNRKVYRRHGAREPLYGVSYAELGRLRKRIGSDQRLAEQLWRSGNHDARVLATQIADPEAIRVRVCDAWLREAEDHILCGQLGKLVARMPSGPERASAWRGRRREWPCAAGWSATASLAMERRLSTDEALQLIGEIEAGVDDAPNRVRHDMNGALIAIGTAYPNLRAVATDTAMRIGRVEVDHGETSCATPEAAPYIAKAGAHFDRKLRRGARKGS